MRTLLHIDVAPDHAQGQPHRLSRDSEADEAWQARALNTFKKYTTHALLRIREGNLATRNSGRGSGQRRGDAISADRLARRRMDEALARDPTLCWLARRHTRWTVTGSGIPEGRISPSRWRPRAEICLDAAHEEDPARVGTSHRAPRPAGRLDRSSAASLHALVRRIGGLFVMYAAQRSLAGPM